MRIGKMAVLAALLAPAATGCGTMSNLSRTTSPNPLVVPRNDREEVWSPVVAVVDDYFDISREDRLAGKITTQPKVAATLFEPWLGDSPGFSEKFEATIQTVRRFCVVTITPAPGGGQSVKVEVFKELEDLAKPDRQTGGRAIFNSDFPVNRTREIVGPVALPLQWVPKGRDEKLEQIILAKLRKKLFL